MFTPRFTLPVRGLGPCLVPPPSTRSWRRWLAPLWVLGGLLPCACTEPVTDPVELEVESRSAGTRIPFGERGRIEGLTHVDQTVTLRRTYTDPIVLVGGLSRVGPDPTLPRVVSVGPDQFVVRAVEAPELDGVHYMGESASYLVFEPGEYEIGGTRVIAGYIETDAVVGPEWEDRWHRVTFPRPFRESPVVLTMINGLDSAVETHAFASTRVDGRTAFGFNVAIERAEDDVHPLDANGDPLQPPVRIAYLAIEPGVTDIGRGELVAGTVSVPSADPTWVQFGHTFAMVPDAVLSLGSYEDPDADPAHMRVLMGTLNEQGVSAVIEEDATYDVEMSHGEESVDFVAVSDNWILRGYPVADECRKELGTEVSWMGYRPPPGQPEARLLEYANEFDQHFEAGVLWEGTMWQLMGDPVGAPLDLTDLDTGLDWVIGEGPDDGSAPAHAKVTAVVWERDRDEPALYWAMSPDQRWDALRDHVQSVVSARPDRVHHFDLVNHALTHGSDDDYMGLSMPRAEAIAQIFKWAVEANPDATYVINEGQGVMFTRQWPPGEPIPPWYATTAEDYRDLVAEVIDLGGRVDAVGVMGHLGWCDGLAPADDEIDAALTVLETLGRPIYITELDLGYECPRWQQEQVTTVDPALEFNGHANWYDYQAVAFDHLLREVLLPRDSVEKVYLWGYYGGYVGEYPQFMWRPDAALWDLGEGEADFQARPVVPAVEDILGRVSCDDGGA